MIKCDEGMVSIHGTGEQITNELSVLLLALLEKGMPESLILKALGVAKIFAEKGDGNSFETEHDRAKRELGELFREMKRTDDGRSAISELVEIIKGAMVDD